MDRLQFWRLDNGAIRALSTVRDHLAHSGLERSLLALVYVRVSQLNGCACCEDAHAQEAIEQGVEERLLREVAAWRESELFSERQRAALAWADSVTEIATTHAPDELYSELAGRFSEKELVALTVAIALMNAFARIAIAFRHGPPPTPAHAPGGVGG
jgi:AhpD family alkylhydroperoxidase